MSSIADEWTAFAEQTLARTQRHVREGAPDDAERYFLLQTLVGAWPIEIERVEAKIKAKQSHASAAASFFKR